MPWRSMAPAPRWFSTGRSTASASPDSVSSSWPRPCGLATWWCWTTSASHKSSSAVAAVEKVGARLVYLPPYSPDLNPIENIFSKLKQLIRGFRPRTWRQIIQATKQALLSLTQNDLYQRLRPLRLRGHVKSETAPAGVAKTSIKTLCTAGCQIFGLELNYLRKNCRGSDN